MKSKRTVRKTNSTDPAKMSQEQIRRTLAAVELLFGPVLARPFKTQLKKQGETNVVKCKRS